MISYHCTLLSLQGNLFETMIVPFIVLLLPEENPINQNQTNSLSNESPLSLHAKDKFLLDSQLGLSIDLTLS